MRYLFILVVVISACSAEKRLERLLKKHPGLISSDTTMVRDTIVSLESRKDTLFTLTKDTVIIKQDRLTVKHYYNTKDSTVYIQGECKADTIYKDRIKIISNVQPRLKKGVSKAEAFGIGLALLLFGLLSGILYQSLKKRGS